MKKLIISFLVLISMVFAPQAGAQELFGFADGKYYDATQTLKYLCFQDNKCYDLNGNFGFTRVAVAPVEVNTEFRDECSEPLLAFQLEMKGITDEYNSDYAEILANTGGQFAGGVEHDVARLNASYTAKRESIEDDRNELAESCHARFPSETLPVLY